MPVQEIVNDTESKMKKAYDVLAGDLKAVRTGRASGALVENIRADYYGNPTPIKQMATIATPQVDMVVIKPFDPAALKEIEKAIKASDLSIAPIIDGKLIRLNIPPLSDERRKLLVGQVKQLGEQSKISIRNIRRDGNKNLEQGEKDKLITEDERENGKKRVDELTKKYTDDVDAIVTSKSRDIMAD